MNLNSLKNLNLKTNKLVFILLVSFVLLYVFHRLYAVAFIGCVYLFQMTLSLVNIDGIARYFRKFLFTLGIIYLLFCTFYVRVMSLDGLNLYLRNVLLLKSKNDIFYFEYPEYPYLYEFILGKIYGLFGSFHVVNLIFGIVTICALISVWFLYRELDLPIKVRVFALLIVASSPIFVTFALNEFKVDLFLLSLSSMTFLVFVSIVKKNSSIKTVILGSLLAFCILTKITITPLVIAIIVLFVFDSFYSKFHLKEVFIRMLALFTPFLSILALWTLQHGMYVNGDLFINRDFSISRVNYFEVDEKAREECFQYEYSYRNSEMFPNDTIFQKILQPYYYVRGITGDGRNYDFSFFDPGVLLYASIFLFFLFPLVAGPYLWKKELIYLYIASIFHISVFYFFTGVALWYLLPIFPLTALGIPIVISNVSSGKLTKFCQNIFFALILLQVLVVVSSVLLHFAPFSSFDKAVLRYTYLSKVYRVNLAINNLPHNKLVLLASERKFMIPLTFVKDSDTKVVPSNYYFYASKKPISEIYDEFKKKNIGYIVVDASMLSNSWYQGCARENFVILHDFLRNYSKPVFELEGTPYIFQII